MVMKAKHRDLAFSSSTFNRTVVHIKVTITTTETNIYTLSGGEQQHKLKGMHAYETVGKDARREEYITMTCI